MYKVMYPLLLLCSFTTAAATEEACDNDVQSLLHVQRLLKEPAESVFRVLNFTEEPDAAEKLMGVTGNKMGDEHVFLSGLVSNVMMMAGVLVAFVVLRLRYPMVYSYNVIAEIVPLKFDASWFSWAKTGFEVQTDDALIDAIGLDSVLMLDFISLAISILLRIGVPGLVLLAPLDHWFGWGGPEVPFLSRFGMGNVVFHHPWLYYIKAMYVAYVCWTVKTVVYKAQEQFLLHRFRWLKKLPHPRSRTVMVEGIPRDCCSEDKVREFFAAALSSDVIEEVHIVKQTKTLEKMVESRQGLFDLKQQAEFKLEKDGTRPEHLVVEVGKVPHKVDSINHYTEQVAKLEADITEEFHRLTKESEKVGESNCSNAFVTFSDRKHVEMAKELDFSPDEDEWVVTEPPELSMVRWGELRTDQDIQTASELVGYAAVFGLYAAFMPICVGITNLANSVDLGPLWASLAPTMGLTIFLSFLPTVLILIIDNFYSLRCSSRVQEKLLVWYYWFQVIFVLLVTAIGNNFISFCEAVASNPLQLPHILAAELPKATHFYMNFLVVQWSTHVINLLRYVNLAKFLGFSALYPEEEAKKRAEPEDQDYYGFGSRSARWTINLLIGVVFGTLNPTIPILALVNFLICRTVYGYLIVAAETKKPDLGGNFWVKNLNHVLQGAILYTILMTGILLERAPNFIPGAVSVTCLLYLARSYWYFEKHYRWQALPFVEIMYKDKDMIAAAAEDAGESYEQPELRQARHIAANMNSGTSSS
mmetsp:Transcript_101228/g.241401  ORF Transcript_101228/g.241401 Transcript_101228/m.241401 type:complete len:758 (+) Transcript_101228:92-2365(+)